MAADQILIGHARTVLVDSVFNAASGGTIDFGTFQADKWSRVAGMFSVVGSFTFRHQMGPSSGTYIVSSAATVNSGPSIFDQVQYGRFVNLGFTAVVSSQPRVFLYGEPMR